MLLPSLLVAQAGPGCTAFSDILPAEETGAPKDVQVVYDGSANRTVATAPVLKGNENGLACALVKGDGCRQWTLTASVSFSGRVPVLAPGTIRILASVRAYGNINGLGNRRTPLEFVTADGSRCSVEPVNEDTQSQGGSPSVTLRRLVYEVPTGALLSLAAGPQASVRIAGKTWNLDDGKDFQSLRRFLVAYVPARAGDAGVSGERSLAPRARIIRWTAALYAAVRTAGLATDVLAPDTAYPSLPRDIVLGTVRTALTADGDTLQWLVQPVPPSTRPALRVGDTALVAGPTSGTTFRTLVRARGFARLPAPEAGLRLAWVYALEALDAWPVSGSPSLPLVATRREYSWLPLVPGDSARREGLWPTYQLFLEARLEKLPGAARSDAIARGRRGFMVAPIWTFIGPEGPVTLVEAPLLPGAQGPGEETSSLLLFDDRGAVLERIDRANAVRGLVQDGGGANDLVIVLAGGSLRWRGQRWYYRQP